MVARRALSPLISNAPIVDFETPDVSARSFWSNPARARAARQRRGVSLIIAISRIKQWDCIADAGRLTRLRLSCMCNAEQHPEMLRSNVRGQYERHGTIGIRARLLRR